jgi:hypothetical protein
MADTEKGNQGPVIIQPPVYSASGDKPTKKSTVVLSAYSAAVTALLLAAIIFGGLMYHAKEKECNSLDNTTDSSRVEVKTKDFEEDGEKIKEEVELDYTKEIEVIKLTKNDGRTNNGIVVVDYRRSLTAMYLPEDDKCFLIGGVDHNIKSPFGEDDGAVMDDDDTDTPLREAEGYPPVKDITVLPEYIRSYCEGKEIRWLERTSKEEMESARQKRSLCYRYRCYYWYYFGRFYYRCYYYYYWC